MQNRHLCGSQSGRSTCLSRPLTQKSQAAAPRDLCRGAEESGSWGCWQVLQRVLLQRVQRQCVVVAARRPREACGVRASGTADLGVPSTGAEEDRTLLDHDYQGLELSCGHLRLGLDRPILIPTCSWPHTMSGLICTSFSAWTLSSLLTVPRPYFVLSQCRSLACILPPACPHCSLFLDLLRMFCVCI